MIVWLDGVRREALRRCGVSKENFGYYEKEKPMIEKKVATIKIVKTPDGYKALWKEKRSGWVASLPYEAHLPSDLGKGGCEATIEGAMLRLLHGLKRDQIIGRKGS